MWKLFARMGAKVGGWFTRSGKAVSLVKTASGSAKYKTISTLFRVADAGLIGYTVYDIFRDGSGSNGSESQTIVSDILSKEVGAFVSTEISDTKALAYAIRKAGVQASSEDEDSSGVRALTLMCCADYIEETEGNLKYSVEDTLETLPVELAGFINGNGSVKEEEISRAEVKEIMTAMGLEEADWIIRRRFDFLMYFLETMSEMLDEEEDGNNSAVSRKVGNTLEIS